MKASLRALLFCFLFSLVAGGEAVAQWKNLSSNLLTPFQGIFPDPFLGAIHFHDGILWAGWQELFFSIDSGKSWQKSTFNVKGNAITDINFYDKLNGVVCTANQEFMNSPTQGVYLTRDGGATWKEILSVLHCTQAEFDGSPDIIHALTQGDVPSPTGLFYTTINGGTSWKTTWPGGSFSQCFTIAKDKIIYVLNSGDNSSGLAGFTSASSDLGATWQQSSAEVDGDSYTICADSCSAKKIYAANEDYVGSFNDLSDLYFSPDAGSTWISTKSFDRPYLSGGMTCSANAVYATSLRQGIYRSTDRGLTWQTIGGPGTLSFDSRNITCADDNIVFVLDAEGSIWGTTNSGGDPLPPTIAINDLILSQNVLFSSDSVLVCDSTLSAFINLHPKGCTPPSIVKVEVTGTDSLSYTAIPVAGDSIGVRFLPVFDSLNTANLILTLSDGTQRTVALTGFGTARFPLTLTTNDQIVIDTLGGAVEIPTILRGLKKPEDITLVVHYDTVLRYNGSFSPGGAKLDIPNEQWPGRSKLKITGATSGSPLGFAHFDVFNDSVPIQRITFDSVTVLTALPICQYISPASATSSVTPITGCGVLTLSQFLHYGRMPGFSIVPNPSGGDASITSTMDLGESGITVYDMLGTEQYHTTVHLMKNTPAKISLPVSNGVYDLRVRSVFGVRDLKVIISK